MSLAIVINSPEGLVLASESRLLLTADTIDGQRIQVSFDNATKLFSFAEPYHRIGTVTYGAGAIGLRSALSYLPEFEASLKVQDLKVEQFAEKLRSFYKEQWDLLPTSGIPQQPLQFFVAGYDEDEPYGKSYEISIPLMPQPACRHDKNQFGILWGGQRNIVDKIIKGYDAGILAVIKNELDLDDDQIGALEKRLNQFELSIPLKAMPLQDCVDLAIFIIKTTIEAQRLTLGIRGTGGPIDVAVINRDGLRYIQKKEIVGELRQVK